MLKDQQKLPQMLAMQSENTPQLKLQLKENMLLIFSDVNFSNKLPHAVHARGLNPELVFCCVLVIDVYPDKSC